MSETALVFESHRPRLFGIAYRMLGTRGDAEDIVQDAYLRWHRAATNEIRSPIAFLVTVTTHLCIDRLRCLKEEREHYTGQWLPEPIMDEFIPSPEMQRELADDVSIAFLAVLERLGPEERATFLLHEIFDYAYSEVSEIIGKSEAACRQMIHRARPRVSDARPRFSVTAESRERLLEKFLRAAESGDRQAVMALLAEEAEYTADGGGKVVAALKVVRTADHIGRLFCSIARRFAVKYRAIRVNGEPGAMSGQGGSLFSVLSFRFESERIAGIYAMRNPDKLRGVGFANPDDLAAF